MIKRVLSISAMLFCGMAFAEELMGFTAPKVHPVERYEASWSKNPFTLKTAPVAVENGTFSKDLAIGTYYGDATDPTVVIVNTKTNERTQLKKGNPATNGMKLNNVKLGSSRKDIAAEVTLGAETSEIRYNDSYLKQVAAAEATKLPATQSPSGAPLRVPMPHLPVQPIKVPQSGATAPAKAGMGTDPLSLGQRSILPQPGEPSGATPSMPNRRRSITPARNAAATPPESSVQPSS